LIFATTPKSRLSPRECTYISSHLHSKRMRVNRTNAQRDVLRNGEESNRISGYALRVFHKLKFAIGGLILIDRDTQSSRRCVRVKGLNTKYQVDKYKKSRRDLRAKGRGCVVLISFLSFSSLTFFFPPRVILQYLFVIGYVCRAKNTRGENDGTSFDMTA